MIPDMVIRMAALTEVLSALINEVKKHCGETKEMRLCEAKCKEVQAALKVDQRRAEELIRMSEQMEREGNKYNAGPLPAGVDYKNFTGGSE